MYELIFNGDLIRFNELTAYKDLIHCALKQRSDSVASSASVYDASEWMGLFVYSSVGKCVWYIPRLRRNDSDAQPKWGSA